MKKNSIKNTRLNQEVQRELSSIIRNDLKDPRVAMMTTVTDAIVATDLKTCKVYISVLGDEKMEKDTMAGLKSAEGFIRSTLAKNMNLRHTPQLIFLPDHSIEYGVKMTKMIEEVAGDDHSGLSDN
ncbi:MAG: 30S ribosome-binding factor RbfA [Lachnospiraceae bacterium]|nr:30S ribosome-binding factor RbfA [Lachnospiraceae bacterium]